MAMPQAHTEWTVDMLDALPDDGQRYEIIDGELFVRPSPSDVHQLVVIALGARLRAYLRPCPIGRVIPSPSDVRRADHRRNRLQPDLYVVRLRDGKRPAYPFELSDLLLVIEVESPGSADYDYQTKRKLYLGAGVPEYWILSPIARTLARWRGSADSGELLTGGLEWHPAGMPEPFGLVLPGFFEDALG